MQRIIQFFSNNVSFISCVLIYVIFVVTFAVWSNYYAREATLNAIDDRLTLASKTLKYILASDFHDRAIDKDSISKEEELRNRAAVSSLAFETEFEWLYTLVEKDGQFFFSAPSVTEEEAKERESWYFYPYDDIPDAFKKAYYEKKPVYISYHDRWGDYRSAAIPQSSPGGRTYLACADYKVTDIDLIMRRNLYGSLLTALFFLIASIPFFWLYRHLCWSHNKKLSAINRELIQHKNDLEDLVEERTADLKLANYQLKLEVNERKAAQEELQSSNDALQKALGDVKLLSGLLPICSYCKKIRDDRGYWNQLEDYLHAHSDIDFSHSICPTCLQKHYPKKNK